MKKLKIIIISLTILVVIIMISLLMLNVNNKNTSDFQNKIEEATEEEQLIENIQMETGEENQEITDTKLTELKVRNEYYIVKACVNKFYTYYMDLFLNEEELEENAEILYSMLDKEYIDLLGINTNNMLEKLQRQPESVVSLEEVYSAQTTENIHLYLVYGNLREKISSNIAKFSMIVKADMLNNTFYILPYDYMIRKGYDNLEVSKINIEAENSIENKKYNIFKYEHITDEAYVQDIFEDYKNNVLYNKEQAYSLLNAKYKEKRFNSLIEYQEYLQNNIKKTVISKLDKYTRFNFPEYTEYVCIDTYGKYYIFQETAPMKYTVILDTYTVDLPEFLEKYNEADERAKVEMNISRVFEAIKGEDFEYVYEKLDESFREQYFTTIEEFMQYAQNTLLYDEIEYNEFSDLDGIYTYTVELQHGENIVEKTFKIQLLEGTDYKISFNIM